MAGRQCIESLSQDGSTLLALAYGIPSEYQSTLATHLGTLLSDATTSAPEACSRVMTLLLLMDLERAVWKQRDVHTFMRGNTLVPQIMEVLLRPLLSPDGQLMKRLKARCQLLSARSSLEERRCDILGSFCRSSPTIVGLAADEKSSGNPAASGDSSRCFLQREKVEGFRGESAGNPRERSKPVCIPAKVSARGQLAASPSERKGSVASVPRDESSSSAFSSEPSNSYHFQFVCGGDESLTTLVGTPLLGEGSDGDVALTSVESMRILGSFKSTRAEAQRRKRNAALPHTHITAEAGGSGTVSTSWHSGSACRPSSGRLSVHLPRHLLQSEEEQTPTKVKAGSVDKKYRSLTRVGGGRRPREERRRASSTAFTRTDRGEVHAAAACGGQNSPLSRSSLVCSSAAAASAPGARSSELRHSVSRSEAGSPLIVTSRAPASSSARARTAADPPNALKFPKRVSVRSNVSDGPGGSRPSAGSIFSDSITDSITVERQTPTRATHSATTLVTRTEPSLTKAEALLVEAIDYIAVCPQLPEDERATGEVLLLYVDAISRFIHSIIDEAMETLEEWPWCIRHCFRAVANASLSREPIGTTVYGGSMAASSARTSSEVPIVSVAENGRAVELTELQHGVLSTMVVLRVINPLIIELPMLLFESPDGDFFEPQFVTIRKRCTLLAKIIQKAANGLLFDGPHEVVMGAFNEAMPSLTQHWGRFFRALIQVGDGPHNEPGYSGAIRSPVRRAAKGNTGPADVALSGEPSSLFTFLDGHLVEIIHAASICKPMLEVSHVSRILQFVQYCQRRSARMTTAAVPTKPSATGTATTALKVKAIAGATVCAAGAASGASAPATQHSVSVQPAAARTAARASEGSTVDAQTVASEEPKQTKTKRGSGIVLGFFTRLSSSGSSPAHQRQSDPGSNTPAAASPKATASSLPPPIAKNESHPAQLTRTTKAEEEEAARRAQLRRRAMMFEELVQYASTSFLHPESTGIYTEFCTIGGKWRSSVPVIYIYGDLLSYHLLTYYAQEDRSTSVLAKLAPLFSRYRTKHSTYRDGDAVAFVSFYMDLILRSQHTRSAAEVVGNQGASPVPPATWADTEFSGEFVIVFFVDPGSKFNAGISWLKSVLTEVVPLSVGKSCTHVVVYHSRTGLKSLLSRTADERWSTGTLVKTFDLIDDVAAFLGQGQGGGSGGIVLPIGSYEYRQLVKERKAAQKSRRSNDFTSRTPRATPGAWDAGSVVEPNAKPDASQLLHPQLLRWQMHRLRSQWFSSLRANEEVREAGVWPIHVLRDVLELVRSVVGPSATSLCVSSTPQSLPPHFMMGILQEQLEDFRFRSVEIFTMFRGELMVHVEMEPQWLLHNSPLLAQSCDEIPETVSMCDSITSSSYSGVEGSSGAPSPVPFSNEVERRKARLVKAHSLLEDGRFRCTWFTIAHPNASLQEYFAHESTIQRLVFLATDTPSVTPKNQVVCLLRDSVADGLGAVGGRERVPFGGASASVASGVSSASNARSGKGCRILPSLRHVTLKSLWRLLLYNLWRTFSIVRDLTPAYCPLRRLCRVIEAELRERNPSEGESQLQQPVPGSSRRECNDPGVGEDAKAPSWQTGDSSGRELPLQTFAKPVAEALSRMSRAEVTLIVLLVGVCRFVESLVSEEMAQSMCGQSDTQGIGTVPVPHRPSSPAEATRDMLRSGVRHIAFGQDREENLSAAERVVVQLLGSHGREVLNLAGIPSSDAGTWIPWEGLLHR